MEMGNGHCQRGQSWVKYLVVLFSIFYSPKIISGWLGPFLFIVAFRQTDVFQ